MPHYNHDDQDATGFPASVTAFADAIRAADGVIIVSPEYNWTIPGTLKNAIDWVSRMKDQPFKDKPVALQSCSGALLGGSRMQYHLRQCLISHRCADLRPAGGDRHLRAAEVRREDAGAEGSDHDAT